MDWCHYRFRSVWVLHAPPDRVYAVLERAEDYTDWWPQVRQVDVIDDAGGVVTVRSVLPYELTFTAREVVRDRAAGVLEIEMSGDLDGWARWTVRAHGAGTLVRFDQVVDVSKPLLRRLAVPGRPVFRVNHRLMMRAGRRGLAAYLEAV